MKNILIGIIIVGLIGILIMFGLKSTKKSTPTNTTTTTTANTKTENTILKPKSSTTNNVYYGFKLPVKLNDTDVTNSLANKTRINISGNNFCEETLSMAEQDAWQIVSQENFTTGDGESFVTDYFKTKDSPAIEFYCHWDSPSQTFDRGTITFISTEKIGSWLLKIKNNPNAILAEYLNVAELMDCNGTIVETSPGITECK
ncbi:MAG: hypothetical protein WCP93_00340 [Candidatus Berkelbacteria bacterium]